MDNREKYYALQEYLEDKSVAVIGSGASILKEEYGKDIDDHDVVVRINRGYPYEQYQKHVGSRTDIWSFGMASDWKNKKKMHELFSDRKFSTYSWWDHNWIPDYVEKLDTHVTLPPVFSQTAAHYCKNKPLTTGGDMINFLLQGTSINKLSVYGVDFYSTGYWFIEEDSSHVPTVVSRKEGVVHDLYLEQKYLEQIVERSKEDIEVNWVK